MSHVRLVWVRNEFFDVVVVVDDVEFGELNWSFDLSFFVVVCGGGGGACWLACCGCLVVFILDEIDDLFVELWWWWWWWLMSAFSWEVVTVVVGVGVGSVCWCCCWGCWMCWNLEKWFVLSICALSCSKVSNEAEHSKHFRICEMKFLRELFTHSSWPRTILDDDEDDDDVEEDPWLPLCWWLSDSFTRWWFCCCLFKNTEKINLINFLNYLI